MEDSYIAIPISSTIHTSYYNPFFSNQLSLPVINFRMLIEEATDYIENFDSKRFAKKISISEA